MSTTAQSAKAWLEEKKPSQQEVTQMIEKLEQRIEKWTGDDEEIQGSIEAADVLQSHLEQLSAPIESNADAKLDTTALIPDAAPVDLDPTTKRQLFNDLKNKLQS